MSSITDIFGSSGDKAGPAPTQYNTWQPQYTNSMDTNFNSAIGNNLSSASNQAPYWASYLSNLTNNPYSSGAQTAANTAGGMYTNAGNQATTAGNNINMASNAVLTSAFDPQSQLYNTQHQNNSDATNASLAARGLNSSAIGADTANQSDINFNEQWLNQVLGRQQSGLSSAASGYGTGNELNLSGAGAINAGGQLPYSTYTGINNDLASGLSTYGTGSTATENQALSPISSYLNLAAGQSNQQGNFDQQYWQNMMDYTQNQNALNNNLWSSIGSAVQNPWGTSKGAFGSTVSNSAPSWLSQLGGAFGF